MRQALNPETSIASYPATGPGLFYPSAVALCLGLLLCALPVTAQDPAAQRLFAAAVRLANGGDPGAALAEYTLLGEQFPRDAIAPEALLRISELQRQLGDIAAARATLQNLSTRFGRSPQAAEAFVLQAEIDFAAARDEGDLRAVRTTLQRVPILYARDRHPGLSARARALLRSAELGLRLDDPAGAASEALRVIEDEAPGPWTAAARFALARSFLRLGELAAGLEILQRVIEGDDSSAAEFDPHLGIEGQRLLSLLERRLLAPAAGQRPWSRRSAFNLGQLGFRGVASVAAAADGRLLVIDSRQQTIALLDADGRLLERRDLKGAERAWFGPDGQPYVVLPDSVRQPFSGASILFADPLSNKGRNQSNLLAAELNPFGEWTLIAKKSPGLLTYRNRRKGRADVLASAGVSLIDLARDARGRLHVLDGKGNRILRLQANTSPSIVARGLWKRPVAIAVDGLGYLFLLDRGERRLTIFDPDGQAVKDLGPELSPELSLRNPADVAVDGQGRVYIADTRLPYLVLLQ